MAPGLKSSRVKFAPAARSPFGDRRACGEPGYPGWSERPQARSNLPIWLDPFPQGVHRQRFRAPFDLREAHRAEVPAVNADVDGVPAAPPVAMHMPEELQSVVTGPGESKHRVVTERQPRALVLDFDQVMGARPTGEP